MFNLLLLPLLLSERLVVLIEFIRVTLVVARLHQALRRDLSEKCLSMCVIYLLLSFGILVVDRAEWIAC